MKKASAALAALTTVLAMAAPAAAATQSTAPACPAGDVPAAQYYDIAGRSHRPNIDCMAWWLIDIWGGSGDYHPTAHLTRAEHAALLANLLDATGHGGSGSTSDQGFTDVRGHRYEQQINRLASLGVIKGKTETQFDPEGRIQRDQMASLIVRLHAQVYGETIQPGAGFSDTNGNVHEENIRRLVNAGITAGKTATTYDPKGFVTREQIATFTMRHTALLVELGHGSPPSEFDTISLSGVGDDVIEVDLHPNSLGVATVNHDGDSNFIVWGTDERGEETDLIVNEIGVYEGVAAVNFGYGDPISGFDIDADGAWSIVIRPAANARAIGSTGGSGQADEVVTATALAGEVVDVTHNGESNFIIWAYDTAGDPLDLVVNEIGPYQGTQRIPVGTKWLEIDADGPWTIKPSS